MVKRVLLFVLAAVLLLVLAVVGMLVYQGKQPPDTSGEYVALGSSFAAGAGLGPRAPGSPLVCMRSSRGYPQLLAAMTGLSLVDMSCSGSTTEHILHGGQVFLGPQLAAVGPDTRLVTITSGGNDVDYIGDLIFTAKAQGWLAKRFWKGPKPLASRDFTNVENNMRRIATVIKQRAPHAVIVFASYPTVVPPQGTCPALGIDEKTAALARQVGARLDKVTRDAAEQSGALFVDMGGAGHDACSSEPWINGAEPKQGMAFHPNATGAKAVAEAVDKVLADHSPPR